MKLHTKSKPISSPGRTEKFQPPLMLRFLRTNVGSKSGRSSSRSRASPMFIRKKNTVIQTNQEPSSPKVSCIGQVRVRRSGSKSKRTVTRSNSHRRRRRRHCWWFRKALFSHRKFGPRSFKGFRGVWRKWVLFFRFGYCKKVDVREDSSESCRNPAGVEYEHGKDKIVDELEEEAKEEFVSFSPPKNAFLLTRCRSAPYRSSSLANRFWESPLKTEEDEEKAEEDEEEEEAEEVEEEEEEETEGPTCCSSSRNEQECRGSLGITQGRNSEGSCRRRIEGGKPLILTRCKSGPARTGEKLIIASISQNKCSWKKIKAQKDHLKFMRAQRNGEGKNKKKCKTSLCDHGTFLCSRGTKQKIMAKLSESKPRPRYFPMRPRWSHFLMPSW